MHEPMILEPLEPYSVFMFLLVFCGCYVSLCVSFLFVVVMLVCVLVTCLSFFLC